MRLFHFVVVPPSCFLVHALRAARRFLTAKEKKTPNRVDWALQVADALNKSDNRLVAQLR